MSEKAYQRLSLPRVCCCEKPGLRTLFPHQSTVPRKRVKREARRPFCTAQSGAAPATVGGMSGLFLPHGRPLVHNREGEAQARIRKPGDLLLSF